MKFNRNRFLIFYKALNFGLTLETRINQLKEEKDMKKIFLLIGVLFFVALGANAQEVVEKDGLYYFDSKPYTGSYIGVYDNGNTKFSLFLKNGKKDGEMRVYFENGKLNEIRHYKKNEMDGTWITYNENEVQVGLANYKDGKKDGEWKVWNDQGKMIYEMNYVNGEKSGTWKKFGADGQILSERTF